MTEQELRDQQMRAAIFRSINGPAPITLATAGQNAANNYAQNSNGMMAGTRSAFTNSLDSQIEREQAEAMARTFKGQEANIAAQRSRAKEMRNRGMPEARMVGQGEYATLTQPNWAESLRGVTGSLLGGYLEGEAIRDGEQLDVDQTEQNRLVLAMEQDKEQAALDLAAFNLKTGYDREDQRSVIQDALDQNKLGILRREATAAELTAAAKSGGTYQGTGIEAQHLNNLKKYRDDRTNPYFIAAEQFLGRPKTVTDAAGTTTTTPGYDVDLILGKNISDGPSNSVVTEKPATEAQKATNYSVGGMFDLHAREGANYIPNIVEISATKLGEDIIGPAITSSKFKAQGEIASQWSRYKTLLMSGKTARADEVIANRNDFFPRFGDKEKDVARKQKAREAEMTRAIEAFELRTGEDFNEDTVIVIEPTISNVNSENMTPEQEKEAIYAKFPALRPQDND